MISGVRAGFGDVVVVPVVVPVVVGVGGLICSLADAAPGVSSSDGVVVLRETAACWALGTPVALASMALTAATAAW